MDAGAVVNPLIRRPSGLEEILITFGDPRSLEGHLARGWEEDNIVRAPLPEALRLSWDMSIPVLTVSLHRHVAPFFLMAVNEIYDLDLWPSMISWGGGFNFREQRGGSKLSTHSWGIAFDIATKENPLGSKGTLNPDIIAVFEKYGWFWGGRFHRPDPMHFQFATNY